MIANQESFGKAINSAGLHEPVNFRWRVTGYYTPDLLEDHLERLTKSTEKYLEACPWPAKELEYGSLRVKSMPLCSREERNKAPLDKNGRAYFDMTVHESSVSCVSLSLGRKSNNVPHRFKSLLSSTLDASSFHRIWSNCTNRSMTACFPDVVKSTLSPRAPAFAVNCPLVVLRGQITSLVS